MANPKLTVPAKAYLALLAFLLGLLGAGITLVWLAN